MAQIQMTLGWVIAYVEDPGEVSAFYRDTFGLGEEFVMPGEDAQMNTGATKLGSATYALGRKNFDGGVREAASEGQPPNVELALVTTEVDEAFKVALDAGCTALSEPGDKPQGQRV